MLSRSELKAQGTAEGDAQSVNVTGPLALMERWWVDGVVVGVGGGWECKCRKDEGPHLH